MNREPMEIAVADIPNILAQLEQDLRSHFRDLSMFENAYNPDDYKTWPTFQTLNSEYEKLKWLKCNLKQRLAEELRATSSFSVEEYEQEIARIRGENRNGKGPRHKYLSAKIAAMDTTYIER